MTQSASKSRRRTGASHSAFRKDCRLYAEVLREHADFLRRIIQRLEVC
jgi:hypothetical protein